MLNELMGMPAGIQGLEAVGTVTASDYGRVFAPMIEKAGRAGNRMRLLYALGPGFQRITRERCGRTRDSDRPICTCSTGALL
ncbi:hypothetical protein [Mycobacterium sp. 1465703.0]|uniref:hypothetical protein n=1 Tax=Mycobacterium sp. 1465703.0 TaxID=1834078 RepID=UPI000A8A6AAB|nr:hypothetical protein [Mycobacterium sp. 1465703.0]